MINIHLSGMIFTYLFLGARVPGDPQRVPFVLSFSDVNSDGEVGVAWWK